jgi:hypothetical protein
MRAVHGLLSLSKAMLAAVFEEVGDPHPPDFVFSVSGRQREEAIAIQNMNVERMVRGGFAVVRNFRDTANAFPSLAHECTLESLEKHVYSSLLPEKQKTDAVQHAMRPRRKARIHN